MLSIFLSQDHILRHKRVCPSSPIGLVTLIVPQGVIIAKNAKINGKGVFEGIGTILCYIYSTLHDLLAIEKGDLLFKLS